MAPRGAWESTDAIQIKDLLDRLEGGCLDQGSLELLVKSDVAPCSRACKSNVRNPYCFCGLAPPEGSFRKRGLWQKDSAVLESIGRDPAVEAREVFTARHLYPLPGTAVSWAVIAPHGHNDEK